MGASLVVCPSQSHPPSGGSITYHGARGGLERLASPLFRALQSSQRCPSTDHSLCCLEGWTTRLGAAAQKLCFPRVRPALILTPALPPRSQILPHGALGQSLRDCGPFPRVPESPGSCLPAHWAPSLLTGNCLPPPTPPPPPSSHVGLLDRGHETDMLEQDPSPWPWSKEKAAFVGCPASWKTIPCLRPALWPQRPASKPLSRLRSSRPRARLCEKTVLSDPFRRGLGGASCLSLHGALS